MSETTAAPVIRFGRGREERAQEAWRTYFETSQRIRQVLDDRLKEQAGMSVSDYNTLLLLWEAPERTLTMGTLAKRLVFSPSRLNYRIKVLEDAGLVEKLATPPGCTAGRSTRCSSPTSTMRSSRSSTPCSPVSRKPFRERMRLVPQLSL